MSEWSILSVPPGWQVTTLGALCSSGGGDIQTGPFGSQLHASDYVAVGIPNVMPQNIGDNVILEAGISQISEVDATRLSRYLLKTGDIVYSRRGDVERRALVRPDQDGWLCGTGCLRVRLGSSADPQFVSYYLGDPHVRRWIVRHAIGATMPNLNTSILGAVPTLVPPRAVQQAIARVLGALDDKIATNMEYGTTALDLAAAHFTRCTSGARDTIRLGTAMDLIYGESLPVTRRRPGPVPVYGSGGRVGEHDVARAPGPGIVIGRKGSVGSIHWCESAFFPIDTTFYTKTLDPSLPMEFFFFTLRKLGLERMNSDSAVPGLNRTDALTLPIKIPNREKLGEFAATTRALFSSRHAIQEQCVSLAKLRDALLPKLMSGEIRVRDAEKIVEDVT